MSTDISKLAIALSEFQGILEQPKLEKEVEVTTKTGGKYKFKYADLSACIRSASPALKSTGLAVTQIVDDGKLVTMLLHSSGQWIKSIVLLPRQDTNYQGFGSALTYLKRYTYCAILGIVADADDDANYASGNEAVVKDRGRASAKSAAPDMDALLKKALADVDTIHDTDRFNDVWAMWNNSCPELTKNGSEFWKAMSVKNQELRK